MLSLKNQKREPFSPHLTETKPDDLPIIAKVSLPR